MAATPEQVLNLVATFLTDLGQLRDLDIPTTSADELGKAVRLLEGVADDLERQVFA